MAKRYFSSEENEIIFSYPDEMRKQIFYNMWTLKKVYVKATGRGIGDIGSVDISISSENSAPLAINKANGSMGLDCTICQLLQENDYADGLAVEGKEKYSYEIFNFQMDDNDFTN